MSKVLPNIRPISTIKNFRKLYSPHWVNSSSPTNIRLLQLNLISGNNSPFRSFNSSSSQSSSSPFSNLFNRTWFKTSSIMVGLTTLGVSSSSNFFTTSANDSVTGADKPPSKGCHLTVAAAWSPKRPRSDLPSWCAADCGEDAYFVAENKSSYCIGIADGVGGWGDIGVDPSQFAWELMNNAQTASLNQENEIDPQRSLDDAYKNLVSQGNVEAGSSTACILSVDKVNGILKSSNLGDSGYVIVRNHSPIYRSRENTHYFNAPYQLSIVPPELDRGNNIKNTPADADQDHYQLEHGDFVVLGTDGLFDNLFNEEIINTIDLAPPPNLDVANCTDNSVIRMKIQNMASELVKKSKQVANDKTKLTPFSKAAQEHGYRYSGGKMDDITVVVLYVDMVGQNQLKPHI